MFDRRPELSGGEYLGSIQQPYHCDVDHERDAELDRPGRELREEERRLRVAAVDKGQREALPQDRAQRDGGQERQRDRPDGRSF